MNNLPKQRKTIAIGLAFVILLAGLACARETKEANETPIEEIALMMPIEAGKTDDWIQTHKELMGPRYEGYAASKERFGIESQVSFLQKTP